MIVILGKKVNLRFGEAMANYNVASVYKYLYMFIHF